MTISAHAQPIYSPINISRDIRHKIKLMSALKAIHITLSVINIGLVSYTPEDLSQPGVVGLRQTSCLCVIPLGQECVIFIQNYSSGDWILTFLQNVNLTLL